VRARARSPTLFETDPMPVYAVALRGGFSPEEVQDDATFGELRCWAILVVREDSG